jgi:sugar phosphate isomerase/epimerase
MWGGNVRALPLLERFRATVRAGFGGLSVTPLEYLGWLAAGLSTADILSMAKDHDVRIVSLDPLARWLPSWKPHRLDLSIVPLAFVSTSEDDFFRIADALQVDSCTAISAAPPGQVALEKMIERFAALCDRAASHGMRVDLEFIPLDLGIPDLATAWSIVSAADRTNGGLTFDFWHYMRSGADQALLKTIPGQKITAVQISDGLREVPASRSRYQDCFLDRLPPGEGEFPIESTLAALREIGALSRVGPEIFSSELDAMDADTIGDICGSSLRSALDSVGVAV